MIVAFVATSEHVPFLQTSPLPQEVPSGFALATLHEPGWESDAQAMAPVTHGFGGSHGAPGVQLSPKHDPALHTSESPHDVPSILLLVVMQPGVADDVAQVVVPMVQGLAGWQG